MKKQDINNQKGEIEFRKKLYLQQVEHKMIFNDELEASDIEKILIERMEKTHAQMTIIKEKNIVLSPYLEIGAERCQRSLVMENDLGAGGAAVDISFDMLNSCTHYNKLFNMAKTPARICCDAYNLPFMTNSIPFVFCYATLHHFPDPAPITGEIYRVLAPGGCFFFADEPFKKLIHFNLYQGNKIYSKVSLQRNKAIRILDYFFSKKICNETIHGIVENEDITIESWKQALGIFDDKDSELISLRICKSDLFHPESYIKYYLACLFGGGISGICRKKGKLVNQNSSIKNLLICPSCRENGLEVLITLEDSASFCPECSKVYPSIDDVIFLLSYGRFEELYPEIFNRI